ncbi:hypothetical protein K2173_000488 [Erythroxylum novogranatense]|uniref:RRM domain-containing protein n=1 Tax=Erythroxylum novogranatense TaxID=1862640 RepID=A0AAV8SWD8_9ROSI|nr:hypothetical protein K2173_000488 [Erythroxylum novogranatense]
MMLAISQTKPATACRPVSDWANAKSRWNFPKVLSLRASLSNSKSNSNSNFPLASRIMVRNLEYSINENSLLKEFSNFGEVAEVKLVKDQTTAKRKAYAFIQYTSQDDAILALENMDGRVVDGRLIYVELARPQKNGVRQYPVASGPPKNKKKPHSQEQDEIADCWY